MGPIDRKRLEEIEKLANDVLQEQEYMRDLDSKRQGNREALGAFRRHEVKQNNVWMQLTPDQ
jgi:hypothetical protein